MKRTATLIFIFILILIIAGYYFYKKPEKQPSFTNHADHDEQTFNRIISLSPGITETLFALGLGKRVVGVTRFCTFPPEAREKTDVGGYLDPNYETIAALQPDLVFVLQGHEEVRKYLSELNLKYVTVRNDTLSDILDAVRIIGNVCGAGKQADDLVTDIESRIQALRNKTKDLPRHKVLISIGRNPGSGSLGDVNIAGLNTFYDELIDCAGGVNAYEGFKIAYPVISAEGLLHLNPDVIIDLVPDLDKRGLDKMTVLRDWQSIEGVHALQNDRVYIVGNDYAVIPGPRFILFLEDLARLIHPEITWENP